MGARTRDGRQQHRADRRPGQGRSSLAPATPLRRDLDPAGRPPGVAAKVGPEAERIDEGLAGFLRVTRISPPAEDVDRPLSTLGAGEQQAIALALEAGSLLVIDDRAGRKAAGRLGIATTGVVGVLLKAKQDGHLPMVGPVVRAIRSHGYWLSDAVLEMAIRLAGESPPPP